MRVFISFKFSTCGSLLAPKSWWFLHSDFVLMMSHTFYAFSPTMGHLKLRYYWARVWSAHVFWLVHWEFLNVWISCWDLNMEFFLFTKVWLQWQTVFSWKRCRTLLQKLDTVINLWFRMFKTDKCRNVKCVYFV